MRVTPALTAAALALLAAVPARAGFDDAGRAAIREEIRDYLLENPEILREMVAILEQREMAAQAASDRELMAAHADSLFDDGFSYVGGNPDGDVTLVEFIDYQCSFCRRAHPEVRAMLEADGDLRLVIKEMPILGPGSELAARAAIATLIAEGQEAYWRLNDALMGLQGQVTEVSLDAALTEAGLDPAAIRAGMDDEEVDRRIAETRSLAQSLGISGTPTYVLEDQMLRGYLPREQMEALVADARARSED